MIETTSSLARVCEALRKESWIALDTEFMREREYWAALCLVQLAAPQQQGVLVDCLAPQLDLSPLYALLRDKAVTKVIHGGQQDMEIFYRLTQDVPSPFFDTQVGSMLCGYQDMRGLNVLAQDFTGKTLDKSIRRSDWRRRPLSLRQRRYALDDVHVLCQIYPVMTKKLDALRRQEWMAEEMALRSSPHLYCNDVYESWRRLSGLPVGRRHLARIRELAAWREEHAQEWNVLRHRVFSDRQLYGMAKAGVSRAMIRASIHSKHRSKIGDDAIDDLLLRLKKVGEQAIESCPRPQDAPFLDDKEKEIFHGLVSLLKACCVEHGVAQILITRLSHLRLLSRGWRYDFPFCKGWRYRLFGERALSFVDARMTGGA
ncbi:MAG: HRDC domain-containing protein [Alphaproteobacteria bacterium GM7ARS4]|nr:HRDC domain-containing protein [Alphaproteobacteria bacterium GM7ARS4]